MFGTPGCCVFHSCVVADAVFCHLCFCLQTASEFSFASLDKHQPTDEQKQAAQNLIESMNLMNAGPQNSELLRPKTTYNPALHRFFAAVEQRALDPESSVSTVPAEIKAYIEPEASLVQRATAALQQFSHVFPLQKIGKQFFLSI